MSDFEQNRSHLYLKLSQAFNNLYPIICIVIVTSPSLGISLTRPLPPGLYHGVTPRGSSTHPYDFFLLPSF